MGRKSKYDDSPEELKEELDKAEKRYKQWLSLKVKIKKEKQKEQEKRNPKTKVDYSKYTQAMYEKLETVEEKFECFQ